MDLKITTTQVDARCALQAHSLYKEGKYAEALPVLLDILDMEPKNWQARLFLAGCYFKTGQSATAQRAFRFIYENCEDQELRQKACFALQAVNAIMETANTARASEFDGLNGRYQGVSAPIDRIIY